MCTVSEQCWQNCAKWREQYADNQTIGQTMAMPIHKMPTNLNEKLIVAADVFSIHAAHLGGKQLRATHWLRCTTKSKVVPVGVCLLFTRCRVRWLYGHMEAGWISGPFDIFLCTALLVYSVGAHRRTNGRGAKNAVIRRRQCVCSTKPATTKNVSWLRKEKNTTFFSTHTRVVPYTHTHTHPHTYVSVAVDDLGAVWQGTHE